MTETTIAMKIPIDRYTLDNGLRVILSEDHRQPVVAVNLWYNVGSRNEREGRTGFAHLFEHMMFQGSQNVPDTEHIAHIERVGGSMNGSTWLDRTNYFETVPAHRLELALWLESDRMGFLLPAMTQEKLDNQRSVVQNERRWRVDNQPYGDWDERIKAMVFPDDHPDFYAADVAAHLLAGGKSSRLYRSLVRERRLAQSVVAYAFPIVTGASLMVVWATANPGVDSAALEEALWEEISELGREVTADELQRVVVGNEARQLISLQQVGERADQLSMFATLFDDPDRINTELDEYRRLVPDDARRFVLGYLRREVCATLVYTPRATREAAA